MGPGISISIVNDETINSTPSVASYELREDGGFELREDGGQEIRE